MLTALKSYAFHFYTIHFGILKDADKFYSTSTYLKFFETMLCYFFKYVVLAIPGRRFKVICDSSGKILVKPDSVVLLYGTNVLQSVILRK